MKPARARFRLFGIFPFSDSLRLARRAPRSAAALLADALRGSAVRPWPRRIGLFLTTRCNFDCPMCAARDARGAGGDMPFDVIERMYRECAAHGPVIDLIGGEPLLYPDFGSVLRLAGKQPVISVVTTNGILLSRWAEAMVTHCLPVVQVSLDGWDEGSQRLRGNVAGSFGRILEGVDAIRRARGRRPFPLVRVLTTITRHNCGKLDLIQRVVHSLGVNSWGISNYFYLSAAAMDAHRVFAREHGLSGGIAADGNGSSRPAAAQAPELRRSLERVRALKRKLRMHIAYDWGADVGRYYSDDAPSRRVRCELPYNRLDVHPSGEIAACVSGKVVGHAGRQGIGDVWRGAELGQFRRMYDAHRPMPMCFRCCGMANAIAFER